MFITQPDIPVSVAVDFPFPLGDSTLQEGNVGRRE